MYTELVQVVCEHEYYGPGECCEMTFSLTPSAAKLAEAMDWVLVKQAAGFALLWQSQRWSEDELLVHFGDEHLVVLIQPADASLFFSITAQLKQTTQYTIVRDPDMPQRNEQVICACVHSVTWLRDSEQLAVSSYPVDSLLGMSDASDMAVIDALDPGVRREPRDDEIDYVFDRCRRKATVVLSMPIRDLLKMPRDSVKRIQFYSVHYHIKYYLMAYPVSDRLSVVSKNLTFESGVESVVPGKPVATFISTEPVVLKRSYSEHPSLIESFNGRENILIDSLPIPKPDNLIKQYAASSNAIIIAESFIH